MSNPTSASMVVGVRDPDVLLRVATRTHKLAIERVPKSSGASRDDIKPWHGVNSNGDPFVGLRWTLPHIWYQENGISPFTMHALEGKTIPMWVEDPDGEEKRKNPNIKTRLRADGVEQVLIFRKAAKKGERKTVTRRVGGELRQIDVPRSYPGAPGRIKQRAGQVFTNDPRRPGQITRTNVGVRWRHPGLAARGFIFNSIQQAVSEQGWPLRPIETA